MPNDPRKYLHDMRQAIQHVQDFSKGKSFSDFQDNALLRSGIERQLEIIGEALNQLQRTAPEMASKIPEHRRIIAFRNVLVHGYATLDVRLVWGVIESKLPQLSMAVDDLLDEGGA